MAKQPEGFSTQQASTEALTEQELKFGYWYTTHKEQIRIGVIIFLITFSVVTYGYALFATGRYYLFWYNDYQNLLATSSQTFINVQGVHLSNAVQDIQVLNRQVISLSAGRINIVARVFNPNAQWALKNFEYQFAIGGRTYELQEGFLLPGEEKYLMMLNVEGQATGTPQVLIDNRRWQRVTKYQDWGPLYTNFVVQEQRFLSPRQGEISDELPVSEVQLTLKNNTPFNFNEIEVQIGLLSGSRLVGITKLPVIDFLSAQTRQLSTRWTQSLSPVSQVEIIPTVNIIDESVYKDFEGEFDPSFIELDDRGRRL